MSFNESTDQVSINISMKLAELSTSHSKCCIYKVHNQLRQINEKAYEPDIISIGPYHRGTMSLQVMEEHKLHYLQLVLQRKKEKIEKYVRAMRSLESKTRECYAEPISLDKNELVEMMLLDGCFIVELIRKFEDADLRKENDPIFEMDWIVNSLQRDLMLFENQLPFFVLLELFDMIENPDQPDRFISLALKFFHDILPGEGHRKTAYDGRWHHQIKHLLELIYHNWTPSIVHMDTNKGGTKSNEKLWSIPCATELREAGIQFEKIEGGSLFDIKFDNGKMRIPILTIEDRTETFFRNLIAYEQYCEDPDVKVKIVTDYVKFLDCLIDTPNDAGRLYRRGVIVNWLGDDEVVSNMFNKILNSVIWPNDHFRYAEISEKVDIHCNRRRNWWMAKLRRNHLNTPWAVISILAAFMLLVLTSIQTVFTILN